MEIKAIIKELNDKEVILTTESDETISLPLRLIQSPVIGKTVYLTIENEPARAPRELLNEILNA